MKKNNIIFLVSLFGLLSVHLSQGAQVVSISEEQKRLQEEIDARWKEHARMMKELKESFKKVEVDIKKQDTQKKEVISKQFSNLSQVKNVNAEDKKHLGGNKKEALESSHVIKQEDVIVDVDKKRSSVRSKALKRAQLEIDKLDTDLVKK